MFAIESWDGFLPCVLTEHGVVGAGDHSFRYPGIRGWGHMFVHDHWTGPEPELARQRLHALLQVMRHVERFRCDPWCRDPVQVADAIGRQAAALGELADEHDRERARAALAGEKD